MKGWGPKSSVCPSKPGKSIFLEGYPGILRDIPEAPEKFEKKMCLGSIFGPYSKIANLPGQLQEYKNPSSEKKKKRQLTPARPQNSLKKTKQFLRKQVCVQFLDPNECNPKGPRLVTRKCSYRPRNPEKFKDTKK